jgi:hypothetical protein
MRTVERAVAVAVAALLITTPLFGDGVLSLASSTRAIVESTGSVRLQVHRAAGTAGTATVDYATDDGTAVSGNDYASVSGTLTFAAGETVKTIDIQILNDALYEDPQSFTIVLSNASAATLRTPTVTTITIFDDEPLPYLSFSDTTTNEGDIGLRSLTFGISLSTPSEAPVDLTYASSDFSAGAGSDYLAVAGTLHFESGETDLALDVAVSGDTLWESDEAFYLTFQRDGVVVAERWGLILNDDPPTVFVADVAVRETDGITTALVTLIASLPIDGDVYFATASGTATGGEDFVPGSGAVHFSNETIATIELVIAGDRTAEEHEQFTLVLWEASGAFTLYDSTVVVTILDDDIGVGPGTLMVPAGERRRRHLHDQGAGGRVSE